MAGLSFSNYLNKKILDYIFKGTAYASPTVYVGLFTADPDEVGSLTNECADANGYARVAIAGSVWTAATLADPSVLANASAITFPEASGSWGAVTHFALLDSGTLGAGNILASGTVSSHEVVSGEIPRFSAAALSISLD